MNICIRTDGCTEVEPLQSVEHVSGTLSAHAAPVVGAGNLKHAVAHYIHAYILYIHTYIHTACTQYK